MEEKSNPERDKNGRFLKGHAVSKNHKYGKIVKGNKLRLGISPWNKGTHIQTNDALEKYSKSGKHPFRGTKGIMKPNSGSFKKGHKLTPKGKNHWNYTGSNNLRKIIQELDEYKFWRKKIFERDKFTCIKCSVVGGKMVVDHIIPFSEIIIKYKIKNSEDAKKCNLLWDVDNGRTMCKKCHYLTETYGFKQVQKIKKLK